MIGQSFRGFAQLLAWTLLFAIVWLIVMPWVATSPSTQSYLQRMRAKGIDPSAMYYTELPPEIFADR